MPTVTRFIYFYSNIISGKGHKPLKLTQDYAYCNTIYLFLFEHYQRQRAQPTYTDNTTMTCNISCQFVHKTRNAAITNIHTVRPPSDCPRLRFMLNAWLHVRVI